MLSFFFVTLLAAPTPTPAATATPAATPVATATPPATPAPDPAPATPPRDPYSGKIAALGVTAGLALPSGELGMSTGFALSARRAVALDRRLVVGLELGYATTRAGGDVDEAGLPPGQNYRVSVTSMPIAADVLWHQPAGPVWIAAGAGLVAAPVTVKSAAGGGTNTERSTAMGAELIAGAEYPLGPGAVAADVSFRFLSASGLKATGAGNLAGPGLRVGYRIAF